MNIHDNKCFQFLPGVIISFMPLLHKFIQDETQNTVSAGLGQQVTYPGRKIGLSRVFLSSPTTVTINRPKLGGGGTQ